MYVYHITGDVIDQCKQFAELMSSSNQFYNTRGQHDSTKRFQDTMYGKLGEWGCYYMMTQRFPNLSKPDMNIYKVPQKGWNPDLSDPAVPIHIGVKTRDIEAKIKWSESWTFQKNDKRIFTDNIDPNYYIACMLLDYPKRTVELRAIVKVQFLHAHGLFQQMDREYLNNTKCAVYYDHSDYNNLAKFAGQLFQL